MITISKLLKRRIPTRSGIILLITIFSLIKVSAQKSLTYNDLANRLVDLEQLSLLPDIGVSYSEITVEAQESKVAIKEGEHYVLAEMDGPGFLSWIGVSGPREGRIMIYLDGTEKPALNYSFSDLSRKWGRNFQNLVYRTGKSLNLRIPIPYQESCRIVAQENWGEICQFGFTTFEKDTQLPAFHQLPEKEILDALEEVEAILSERGKNPGKIHEDSRTEIKEVNIKPGETLTMFNQYGIRAITSLKVSLDIGQLVPSTLLRQGTLRPSSSMGRVREIPDTHDDWDVLRELMLSIYWDKEKNPAVLTPLGDFFGSAPGWNTHRTLVSGMTANQFYSYWYMPFEKDARITLRNDGENARTLSFEITHAPLNKPTSRYGRFHARWQREKPNSNRIDDWTAFETTGRGTFCGSVIDIYNPKGTWWGESDFKLVVDQKNTPLIAGTGLDLLYGTWGKQPYSEAFQAHTITDRSMVHRPHESLNRWYIADNIRFQESIKLEFKKKFPSSDSVIYTTTMFWYQEKCNKGLRGDISLEDRVDFPRVLSEFGVTNCIEGEDMDIIAITGGEVSPLYIEGLHTGGWSGLRGKQQLWWRGISPGDTLSLTFPVDEDDEYKLRIKFIRGEGYGLFRVFLDDELIDGSLDLFNPGLAPTGPMDFGLHHLKKGSCTLTMIASEHAQKSGDLQFGLDYLQLEAWDGTRDPKPKVHHVAAGEFTNFFGRFSINDHSFIQDNDGTWHFYGIGGSRGFAHGTSKYLRDINWEQADYPFPVEWNPWREMHLWAPHVVKHEDLYYMFYCAGGKTGSTYRMHLATSPDHKTWIRHEENPLFKDGFGARDPMVLQVEDEWIMYYCATTDYRGGNHVVAYRKSKDLIHWGNRQIAFIDPRRHKAGGGTESPFVVRRGDTYYLLIGPREGYSGTDIFSSKDPFRWYLEDRVGHIDAHAAEVVRDVDGKWYISHSGVGEGGLYLAPLEWNDGLDGADSSLPIP